MFNIYTMFIMRGLPGSGKTLIAESILGGKISNATIDNFRFTVCPNGVICSSDAYFYEDWENQENYSFKEDSLYKLTVLNQKAALYHLEKNIPAIVIDNSNIEKWEVEPYLKLAHKYNYKTVMIEVPSVSLEISSSQSIHNVSKSELTKLRSKWEVFSVPGSLGKKIV